jgi:hypothetical protein
MVVALSGVMLGCDFGGGLAMTGARPVVDVDDTSALKALKCFNDAFTTLPVIDLARGVTQALGAFGFGFAERENGLP